mgnify:CR=1 FL=1
MQHDAYLGDVLIGAVEKVRTLGEGKTVWGCYLDRNTWRVFFGPLFDTVEEAKAHFEENWQAADAERLLRSWPKV